MFAGIFLVCLVRVKLLRKITKYDKVFIIVLGDGRKRMEEIGCMWSKFSKLVLRGVFYLILMVVCVPLQALGAENIIYVSGSNGNDTYTGTSVAPVKTIEKALELVEEEGTIQIIGSTFSAQPSEDEPLIITKNITITGGELTLSKAGIMLGADVTFQNVSINLANPVRNAIIANGYTLNMENVIGSGTYPLHLFSGSVTGYAGSVALPLAGNAGEIIIAGTQNNIGNVFAGSLSEYGVENTWTGSSDIIFAANAGGTFGNVYAHGATEPRGQGDGYSMIPNAAKYMVSGNVDITISGSKPVAVYGTTGGIKNASVIAKGSEYAIIGITLDNIDSLTVSSGVLQPAVLNEGVNVTINADAELNLSDVIADETVFSVGDFYGGGMLVIGQNDSLCIEGIVTGNTEFQTTTNRPADKSTSGLVEYDFVYIDVTKAIGDGMFTYSPCAGQKGAVWEKVTENESVVWKVLEPIEYPVAKPVSFTILNTSYSMSTEEVAQVGMLKVPVSCELAEDEWLYDVPLHVSISKDGSEPIEAVESYGYSYEYMLEDWGFEAIFCEYDDEYEDQFCIYFYLDAFTIKSGEYNVNFSITLSNDSIVTETVVLTIYEDMGNSLSGYTLSLDGNIGVNFHMELSERVLMDENAYMQFTLGGEELQKVMVADVKDNPIVLDGQTYYIFPCGVPAKDMQTEIGAQIVLGDGTKGLRYTYTVQEYADYILNPENGYDEVTLALVKAMLEYGDYASAYFNDEKLIASENLDTVTIESLKEFEGTVSNEVEGMYYGSSLLLKTETILRHYFTEEVPDSVKKGNLYYIDIPNIAAHRLHLNTEINVNGMVITYSPLSYAYKVLSSETTDESLRNLVKAMYLYNQAAVAYKNA